jgi:hypothetical protein
MDAAPGSEGCLRQRLPVRQEAILVTSAGAQAITATIGGLRPVRVTEVEVTAGATTATLDPAGILNPGKLIP